MTQIDNICHYASVTVSCRDHPKYLRYQTRWVLPVGVTRHMQLCNLSPYTSLHLKLDLVTHLHILLNADICHYTSSHVTLYVCCVLNTR